MLFFTETMSCFFKQYSCTPFLLLYMAIFAKLFKDVVILGKKILAAFSEILSHVKF